MLIRFFAYFYPPCIGGGEVILQHQAEELARRGHEVHVHCTAYRNIACTDEATPGASLERGVHVHRARSALIPFRNPLEKDAITPGLLAACRLPADVRVCVGFPSLHLDLLDLLYARLPGRAPLIVQNYITADFLTEILSPPPATGRAPRNKRLRARYWRSHVQPQLRRAALVLADSPAAARALSAQLDLPNVRTHIGMAVDPAEFDAVTEADIAAAGRAIGAGGRYLLAPSRLSRQKGADLLIAAAAPLLQADPGLQVVICGPVNEPEFAAAVRAQAAPFGDQVRIGELPRAQFVALIRGASVVCLPSRGETVGGVAFEGMYAGVPVVVSDAVEAAREDYLRDDACGRLFRSEDVADLRRALSEALLETPTGAPQTGARVRAARELVRRRFTWEGSADRLLELWREAGIPVSG